MKPILRAAVVIGGLLVLLALGVAAYLRFAFDPNDYRDTLARLVQERTGRQLVIDGQIELSVFPSLAIELGETRLGNAAGFSERPFASVKAVQAGVKLLPLLGRKIELDRVVLDGLTLSLEKRADGTTNWADLGGAEKAPGSAAEAHGGGTAVAGFELGGLEVRDGALMWDDRQGGKQHSIDGLSLEVGAIRPGKPFDLKVGLGFKSAQPAVDGTLQLAGRASVDTATGQYALDDMRLVVNAAGQDVPGGKTELTLTGRLAADLGSGTASATGLQLAAYGLSLQADLAITGLGDTLHVSGPLKLAQFDPAALMKALGADKPADAGVLKRASLSARIEGGSKGMALRDLALSLDDSTLSGRFAVEDFDRMALRFDLSLDRIDLDRYPSGGAGKQGGTSVGGDRKSGQALPALDVDGRLAVGALKYSGLSLSDLRLALNGQGGRYRLRPEAALYGGRYRGNIALDGHGKVLSVSTDDRLEGVAIGPLLRALSGREEKLTGRADVTLKLRTAGPDAVAYKRNLDGVVALRVSDGAVKGVNIAAYLRQAQARLSGKPVAAVADTRQTDFSDLSATLSLAGGVAHNKDLSLRSPLLRVGGEGSANLNTETIDYLVRASVVGTLTGQDGKSLDRLRGVTVPIRVTGTFAEPKFALDVNSLVSGTVKEKIEEKKTEIRQKAGEALKKELEKGLGGLFR